GGPWFFGAPACRNGRPELRRTTGLPYRHGWRCHSAQAGGSTTGAEGASMPLGKCLECRRVFITARPAPDADGCPNCVAVLYTATQDEARAVCDAPPPDPSPSKKLAA